MRPTWQKVEPVVLGCPHEIAFENPTILLYFVCRTELEVVRVWELGRGDAAETIIYSFEALHWVTFNRLYIKKNSILIFKKGPFSF